MPWVLIALAVGLAAYGATIRATANVSSQTTEFVPPPRPAPVSGKHHTEPATANPSLAPDKRTKVESAPSDAFLGVLFGAAATLALAGAFYSRITKVTLPGGAGIELAALSSDLEKVQQTVPAKVAQQIDQLPAVQKQALEPEQIARITSTAATQAQRELLEARAAARGVPVSASVALPTVDINRAQTGMPLSDDLIERLVDTAVGDAVRKSMPAVGR